MINYDQTTLDIVIIVQKFTAAGATQSAIQDFLKDVEHHTERNLTVDINHLDIYIKEILEIQKTMKYFSLATYLDDQFLYKQSQQ